MILLSFVKNNKASILPVTIVSMFVLIIIGYASLKIGISRSNIATTEQIKMRTLYAAEGVTERMKTNLHNYIDNNYTIKASSRAQASLTDFDLFPKSSTDTIQGDNNKFEFEEQIIFAGFNGFDFNDFDSNFGTTYGNTYPKIKISTYVVVTSSTTGKSQTSPNIGIEVKSKGLKGRVIDTGMEFYRQKIGSVSNVPSSSTTYRNSGFSVTNINNTNYINQLYGNLAGIDYQHRGLVANSSNGGLKLDNCYFVFDVTDEAADYRPYNNKTPCLPPYNTDPYNNHKTEIENYVTSKNATNASFIVYQPTAYFIKHSSRGYVFSVTAENEHKSFEPVVSCTINTYFDLYAAGLYRRCRVYRFSIQRTQAIYKWFDGAPPHDNPSTEYSLVEPANSLINKGKIKYIIQRQEVIVN